MKKILAAIALVLSLLGLHHVGVAHADTIFNTQFYGCDANSYHYRLTEHHWQASNGSYYKTFYVDIIHKFNGQMAHQNAFHGWAPYHVYPSTVAHAGSPTQCWFAFSAWPGFGYSSVHWNPAWSDWRAGEWIHYNVGTQNWNYIGTWDDRSPAISLLNDDPQATAWLIGV